MSITQLAEQYFVTPQISVEQIEAIAAAGFQKVVNNRPDGESEDQPSSADLQAVVEAAGLVYVYNPVDLSKLSQNEVDAQQAALADNVKTLAFCRTGTRSSVLWVLLQQQAGDDFEQLCQQVSAKGFDLQRCLPAMQPLQR